MFTIKFEKNRTGHVSFRGVKPIINRSFKYRTLGEMIAQAKMAGVQPLPTRNGVYTGESVIPREQFDKLNVREDLMNQLLAAEQKLAEAKDAESRESANKEREAYKKQVIDEYVASLKP